MKKKSMMKQCPGCGREVTFDCVKCPSCGHLFDDVPDVSIQAESRKKPRNLLLAIIGAAFAVQGVVEAFLGGWIVSGLLGLGAVVLSIVALRIAKKDDKAARIISVIAIVIGVGCMIFAIVTGIRVTWYLSVTPMPV